MVLQKVLKMLLLLDASIVRVYIIHFSLVKNIKHLKIHEKEN